VGKLNFFRWALEKGILTYIKGHQEEIEKEMNAAMKEQAKKDTSTTRDSQATATTATTATSQTRKRVISREPSSIKLLQKHDCMIEMSFD
jgi:hypothetical protein